MLAGSYQLYWHRPLIAYLSPGMENIVVLPDALLGYLTAYDAKHPDLDRPIELWPRPYERSRNLAVIQLFKEKTHQHKTITRTLNLLTAQELLGKGKLPRSFARQILMLPEDKTLD